MSMIRRPPPELVTCPACKGTGNRVESDERGEIPDPEKVIGSLYDRFPDACRWCASTGRIVDRMVPKFERALRDRAQKILTAPE